MLTFRGLSGCKAMPGWQGGFVGSKKFFEQIGVEKFGWVRCQSGKSFHCNLRILSSGCYSTRTTGVINKNLHECA